MLIEIKAQFSHNTVSTGKLDLAGIHAVSINNEGIQWLGCKHEKDLPILNDITPLLSPDDFLHCASHEGHEECWLRRSCIWGYVESGSILSILCGTGMYAANPQLLDEVISIVEKNNAAVIA